MSRQWLRKCTLEFSGGGGMIVEAGESTQLKVEFATESRTSQAPHQAQIVITNASPATAAKLQAEFTKLTLSAGYAGNYGPIFTGQIIETQYGEKVNNYTDTLLRIWCSGWDDAYNQAKVSTTLAAGSTPQDVINTCLTTMAPFGVTMGQIAGIDLSQPRFPRGIVLAGMARDYIREVAQTARATWTINDGKLDIIGKNATLPSTGIVISKDTGMIGQPILRPEGVICRCRINPTIRVNSTVQIKAKIIAPTFNLANDSAGSLNLAEVSDYQSHNLNATSFRVLHIKTQANSREGPWEMELTCLGNGSGFTHAADGLGYS